MGRGKKQKKHKKRDAVYTETKNSVLLSEEENEDFGKYTSLFEKVDANERRTLRDPTSAAGAYVPVQINKTSYLAEPDGKLISNRIQNQRKCDFLLFVPSDEQTNFIELKGTNISNRSDKSPHNQICQTIDYFIDDDDLKRLIIGKVKHAFIVSPSSQRIPSGIETEERKLFQKLAVNGNKRYQMGDLIHYVKVIPKGKYSCNRKQIVCTNSEGIPIPFTKVAES